MHEELSYQIAGHVLAVSGENIGQAMDKLLGFSVFATDKPAEWHVNFDCDLEKSDFLRLHTFSFEDLPSLDCVFGVRDDNVYVLTLEWNASSEEIFRMEYNGGNVVRATTIVEPSRLGYILWSAFNLLAVPYGMMAIHSSTIVCNGRANLFLGESGTGKSTHTRLWFKNIEGSRLLNDDSPIVSVEDGRVVVYGSPWSGKTPCYHNVGFPVNAFVRLRQEKQNVITKLNVFQAFAALQPSTPPSLSYSDFYSSKVIENLDSILSHVPVYQLDCLPNDEAAHLAYETIYKS